MKNRIYALLVNSQPGITERYHKFHDGSSGAKRLLSWAYLLWLNFAYYCLFCRFLGKRKSVDFDKEIKLICNRSESEEYLRSKDGSYWADIDAVLGYLLSFDIISFDIFDTLILRPFSAPTDVFHMLGEQFGIMDFKNIRIWAESDARIKHNDKFGNMEVNLSEIWDNLEKDAGLSSEEGQKAEILLEEKLCYANPYMKKLWDVLIANGKTIVIVSDMYLPKDVLERILKSNGFTGYDRLYLSNEYGKSKADGTLFKCVRADFPGKRLIHIGDNPVSDGEKARKSNFEARLYPGIFKHIYDFRPFDMSAIVGSAYRAIVSAALYNGLNRFSMDYEYGYVYGGLFVLGYCSFIRKYSEKHGIDKILFLSRDGDTLKQAYDYLYPDNNSSYVYWSRKAATKLEAFYDKHDFFRRFLYHKVNQKYTIEMVLKAMELDELVGELSDWRAVWETREWSEYRAKKTNTVNIVQEKGIKADEISEEEWIKSREKYYIELKPQDELTDKNGYLLRRFIEAKWDKVLSKYTGQLQAAKKYYSKETEGCSKVLAVDIGWAGSGAMTLRHLFEHEWGLKTEVIGMIAGTNTVHNFEPDASESFLQSGKLVSYLYSQSYNRDLLKKHDPNRDYNIFWELLLSSPTPKFEGFYEGRLQVGSVSEEELSESFKTEEENRQKDVNIYISEIDVIAKFGKFDYNQTGIVEIQRGILDFVKEYHSHFRDFPYMFNISGRDAYAPMLVAASHREKYLKAVEKRFKLEINVD